MTHASPGRRSRAWRAGAAFALAGLAVAAVLLVSAAVRVGPGAGEHDHGGAHDAAHGRGSHDGAAPQPVTRRVVATHLARLTGGGVVRVQVVAELPRAAASRRRLLAGSPVTLRATLQGAGSGRPKLLAGTKATPPAPLEQHDTLLVNRRTGEVALPMGAHGHDPGRGLSGVTGSPLAWATTATPGAGQVEMDPEGRRLLLAHPETGRVEVVDILRRAAVQTVAVGKPGAIVFEPSGRRAWVPDREQPIVSVVDLAAGRVAGRITTPGPVGQIAFDPSGRTAVMAGTADGRVTLVDAQAMRPVEEQRLPAPTGRAAYVDALDGFVVADGQQSLRLLPLGGGAARPVARGVSSAEGLVAGPDGRTVAALGEGPRALSVVDVASGRVSRIDAGAAPTDLRLLGRFAMVRSRREATVTWVDMLEPRRSAALPIGSAPASALTVDVGGRTAFASVPAEGRAYAMHVMHGRPMVMEETRTPRAADVVFGMSSRATRTSKGVYEQRTVFDRAGRYRVEIRVPGHGRAAFGLTVASRPPGGAQAQPLTPRITARVGQPVRVRFAVRGAALGDAAVLAYSSGAGGIRQLRAPARPVGDGVYEAVLQPVQAGRYRVFLLSEQARLTARTGRPAALRVSGG